MRSGFDLVEIVDNERYEEADAVRRAQLAKENRPGLRQRFALFSATVISSLNLQAGTARSARLIKTYWWVPAGFAVLVLLNSIVGR